MSRAVYLDPGHGGKDPGAVAENRREADDNLRLALALRPLLNRQGITAYLSRTDNRDISIAQRTAQANALGVDLFVSLHRNAFNRADACGAEVWVYTHPTKDEQAAAQAVMKALGGTPIQKNRGVKRGNYGVLRETRMPAILVELGFITNTTDNRLFDTHFDTYVKALALGIGTSLDQICGNSTPATAPSGQTGGEAALLEAPGLYRVQVGAFADRRGAEHYACRIQTMGINAYVVAP